MSNQEEILKDIQQYKDLKAVAQSAGGQIVLQALVSDILSVIASYGAYKTLTHQEFIALSAKLSVLLGVYRSLTNAESNEEILQKILKEQA